MLRFAAVVGLGGGPAAAPAAALGVPGSEVAPAPQRYWKAADGEAHPRAAAQRLEAGRGLFEHGLLGDGTAVVARGVAGTLARGADAACARCHRPSGQGGAEGGVRVPPVTGGVVFRAVSAPPRRLAHGMRFAEAAVDTRPAYDSRSLRRVLREGRNPVGRALSPLMPRYRLSARDGLALEAYLRQLGVRASPGVDGHTLHWAIVSTPGAAPERRTAQREVLRRCAAERFPTDDPGRGGWVLHDWDLHGDPADWPRQLRERARRQPVFALLGGTGTADWAPVHRFCEDERIPCLFPDVDLPGDPVPGRSSFYFSGGVALEAALIAERLIAGQAPASGAVRAPVRQWISDDRVAARAGADELRRRLALGGILTEAQPAPKAGGWVAAAASVVPGETWVLWLDGADVTRLYAELPVSPPGLAAWGSGWLAPQHRADDAAIPSPADVRPAAETRPAGVPVPPPSWRLATLWIHPFDAAGRLSQRLRFNLRPWLRAQQLPDEPALHDVQGNALSTCLLAAEAVAAARQPLTREQLVEQIENYPAAMGNAPAAQVFHVFNLAPGRRISSPGAFVVRWTETEPPSLQPVGDWAVVD